MDEKFLWKGTLDREKDKHDVLPVSLNKWVLSLFNPETWEMTKEASEEIVKVTKEQWLSIAYVLRVIYNKAVAIKDENIRLKDENDKLRNRVRNLEEKLYIDLNNTNFIKDESSNFIKDEINKLSDNGKDYILSWKWVVNKIMINYINDYRKNLKKKYNNNFNKIKIWKEFSVINERVKKINLEGDRNSELYNELVKDLYIELWWNELDFFNSLKNLVWKVKNRFKKII